MSNENLNYFLKRVEYLKRPWGAVAQNPALRSYVIRSTYQCILYNYVNVMYDIRSRCSDIFQQRRCGFRHSAKPCHSTDGVKFLKALQSKAHAAWGPSRRHWFEHPAPVTDLCASSGPESGRSESFHSHRLCTHAKSKTTQLRRRQRQR